MRSPPSYARSLRSASLSNVARVYVFLDDLSDVLLDGGFLRIFGSDASIVAISRSYSRRLSGNYLTSSPDPGSGLRLDMASAISLHYCHSSSIEIILRFSRFPSLETLSQSIASSTTATSALSQHSRLQGVQLLFRQLSRLLEYLLQSSVSLFRATFRFVIAELDGELVAGAEAWCLVP